MAYGLTWTISARFPVIGEGANRCKASCGTLSSGQLLEHCPSSLSHVFMAPAGSRVTDLDKEYVYSSEQEFTGDTFKFCLAILKGINYQDFFSSF